MRLACNSGHGSVGVAPEFLGAAFSSVPDGRAVVVGYLQRSRANGDLIVEGGFLRLLSKAGDPQAQIAVTIGVRRQFGTLRRSHVR
ncbi:hypothetical protein MPLB_1490076 [Mesorhizobium sp. ORS 3324]|nr:hypothetical protein MPLB_1490076 [Mesorhizobium sp. ORS 3324]